MLKRHEVSCILPETRKIRLSCWARSTITQINIPTALFTCAEIPDAARPQKTAGGKLLEHFNGSEQNLVTKQGCAALPCYGRLCAVRCPRGGGPSASWRCRAWRAETRGTCGPLALRGRASRAAQHATVSARHGRARARTLSKQNARAAHDNSYTASCRWRIALYTTCSPGWRGPELILRSSPSPWASEGYFFNSPGCGLDRADAS